MSKLFGSATKPAEVYANLVKRGQKFLESDLDGPPGFNKWRLEVIAWLKIHHSDSDAFQSVRLIPKARHPKNIATGRGLRPSDRQNALRILKLLANFDEKAKKPLEVQKTQKEDRRIFLVHGRHNELKISVARFLEHLDLVPIILHEQADKGRTIVDKFIQSADVGFAVVLLTGDDMGGLASSSPDTYKLRARQNVILELGYFMGRLRPDQIAAIYQHGVEIPTDYQGKLFIPFDDEGAWRFHLAREIRASGIKIDLNKI